ncbi:hypothetical protein GF373_17200 [bacterium]|nr:hypothetical protein [bacterium]
MPSLDNQKNRTITISDGFKSTSFSGADIRLLAHSQHPNVLNRYQEMKLEDIDKQIQAALLNEDTTDEDIQALNAVRDQVGQDIGDALIPLASAQTLSISIFRETVAVRGCGSITSKGHTRGPRTVAGSIIFIQMDEHALAALMHNPPTRFAHESRINSLLYIDQLPPFIISAAFANEYGKLSQMNIYGIQFISDGIVLSIEDIFTEDTCTFIATDVDTLHRVGDTKFTGGGSGNILPTTGSSILRQRRNDPLYKQLERELGVKRSPFI